MEWLKTQPWKHQIEAYLFSKPLKGAMLAMEMGTGKSLTAIMHASSAMKTLIICPKSVLSVWPREFQKHLDTIPNIVVLDNGSTEKKADLLIRQIKLSLARNQKIVAIVNYESVWRRPLADILMRLMWDLIIADEIHRIKSPSGVASRFMAKLAKRARKRIGLTGTPMPHSPLDIYAQYRFLNPSIFGYSYTLFKDRYAVLGGYGGYEVMGYKNMNEFRSKYKSIAFEIAVKDVLDLPEPRFVIRTCNLSNKALKIYNQLDSIFTAEVGEGTITATNALTKLLRLQQITGGFLPDDDGNIHQIDSSKEELLDDILEDLPEREPLVVFARFRNDLDVIHRVAIKRGLKSSELSGRRNDLDLWQKGKTDLIAVQIQSGSVGIDLTRARYAIFYSLGFSLGDYLQALARLHRPGQENIVTYIHLVVENTVDKEVYDSLRKKQDVIESIIKKRLGFSIKLKVENLF